MPLYKVNPDTMPPNLRYRLISPRPDLYGGCHVVEADTPAEGLTALTADEAAPYADLSGCIATWETVPDPDPEIDEAVAKIVDLSNKWPDRVARKLKGKVDLPTTENLLSSDGKQVKIDAPQGWR